MTGLKLAPGLTLPVDAVTQTFGILAKRGAGKSNAAAVMAEEMHAAGLQFVVVDPVGAWWGLRSSADGSGPGLGIPVLGGYHGDVPLEPTPSAGELVADLVVDERLSCVLDVSSFDSETKKRTFLASFAERLFRQKGRPGREEPLHLFLEETDDYAPQRATGEVARCLGAFQRIVKRGRARGVGSTMISQRSAALNKDLLTQIDTLIALRTTGPLDRKAIEGWVTYHDTDDAIISSLSELRAGEAWVWSPEFLDLVKRVQIRRRRTFDSGATPKAGTTRRAPKGLADVDVSALEARMAETIERAKAEDPGELRRRIRELELSLRKERAARDIMAVAVPPEPEIIEVPLVPTEDLQYLKNAAGNLHGWITDAYGLYSQFEELRTKVDGVLEGLLALWERGVGERAERALPAPTRGGAATPAKRQEQAAMQPRPSRATEDDAGPAGEPVRPSLDGHVSPSEQRILDALGWLQAANLYPPPRQRLGWVAGYKPSGGRFNNLVGAMNSAGLIHYPTQGFIAFTDAGAACAEVPSKPLTVEDMQKLVLQRLSESERKVLSPLLDRYPAALSRVELAAASDYDHEGGRFNNLVGRLSSLGLVEYPMKGAVRAAPVVFLEDL